jgi:hypothetical protein
MAVEKNTIEDVLEWYRSQHIPKYTIMQKNKWGKGYYDGTSMEDGIVKLQSDLEALKGSSIVNKNDYELHLLKTSTAKSKGTSDLKFAITFNFSGEYTESQIGSVPMFNQYGSTGISKRELIDILDERDKQKELQEIEDEVEDLEPEQNSILAGFTNSLNTLAQAPEVQQAFATGIISLASTIGSIFTKKAPLATSLAGVCDNKDVNEVIEILYSKGVKIDHLRKLAEMDQAKIQMLISML